MDGDTQRSFYHTPKTRELNNLLGDIYHKILGMFFTLIYIFHGKSFVFEYRDVVILFTNFADRYGESDC